MGQWESASRSTAHTDSYPWPEHAFRRALEQATLCAIAAFDSSGRQVYANAAFCELVGWTERELTGAEPPFVYWPPEEREVIRSVFDQALGGESRNTTHELRFQRRSGERFEARVVLAPVEAGAERASGLVASIEDVGERKRHERRAGLEGEIVRIVSGTGDLAEAAPDVIRTLCETLEWDMGALWRVEGDAGLVLVAEAWVRPPGDGEKSAEARGPSPSGGVLARVVATGQPVWIPDVARDPAFLRRAEAARRGLRSALAVPVGAFGRVAGVLELFSRDLKYADPELIGTAVSASELIGHAFEQEAARMMLRESEQRYHAIVDMANEGIWLIDSRGRTAYANRCLATMLNATPLELARASVLEFCFPEDTGVAMERLGSNLAGVSEQFDFRFRRKDGSELLTLACTSPMRDAAGRVIGVVGMFSDVTDRKKSEEAAHRLAAIVESSDDAIIGKTLDGTILSWNSAAVRIYGYSEAEAIGRSMTMLLPPERPDEETGILSRLQRGERVDHFETVRMRKDGQRIYVSMTISPIRDKSGRIIGASSVSRDITDRRQFEEQLRETQKLESLGVLAGGVAHDFNNLLVGIMGNASLALDTVAHDDPARPMMEGALQAGERAANLTRQLLAYSGKGKFVIQRIDISQSIREIVALIRSSISKNVRVVFDLDDALPPIEADVAQIQQLIMNLVINGAEAAGDDPGTVTVRTRVDTAQGALGEPDGGQYALLEVEDDGCGMDEVTRQKMFDPFFTTKFTGRGLGLAAVLGIVRGHKGTIDVDTAPGRGTRFSVRFPVVAGAALDSGPRVEHDFKGQGTVLVIDDEEIVRNTARAALERYGYQVLVASNGEEAMDCLNKAPQISTVLLDLTMPVMSGEQTLRGMKALRPDLNVILSSGYNEVEAIRRFHGQGLAGFLQKPYTAEQLAEKVKRVSATSAGS